MMYDVQFGDKPYQNINSPFIHPEESTRPLAPQPKAFNNTLENLKYHLDGCKLQFINISNLNMSQMSKYDEIIFTDNAHDHFDFILDIFAENNPTINLILLLYNSVSYIK